MPASMHAAEGCDTKPGSHARQPIAMSSRIARVSLGSCEAVQRTGRSAAGSAHHRTQQTAANSGRLPRLDGPA